MSSWNRVSPFNDSKFSMENWRWNHFCGIIGAEIASLEFFFQEQSYSGLHSGRSLAWDHVSSARRLHIGARCGDVCVWGSDVSDRAEVIRCDDIGARCGDVGARRCDFGDRAELPAISARSYWRYRRLQSWYNSADV